MRPIIFDILRMQKLTASARFRKGIGPLASASILPRQVSIFPGRYVRSGSTTGKNNGTSWANAFLTMALCISGANGTAAMVAGEFAWVAHDHSESTGANVTLVFPGTAASPNNIYCVNAAVENPIVPANTTTGAIVATTGAFNIDLRGVAQITGIAFSAGSAAGAAQINFGAANNSVITLINCALRLSTTGAAARINICSGSTSGVRTAWLNTTVQFGAVGQGIISAAGNNAVLEWRNTLAAIVLGTNPTNLFISPTIASIVIEGVDLTNAGTNALFSAGNLTANALVKDCKITAGNLISSTPTAYGPNVYVVRTDSSGSINVEKKIAYAGSQIDEATIIRTGGDTKSRNITATANAEWVVPFETVPISIYNTVTAANVTVTIYGTWNVSALPNNDDIWIDVEYPGSAASPLGSMETTTKANNLAAGVSVAADASAWGGGGSGAGWTTFKIVLVLDTPQPQLAGPLSIYLKAGKPSATFYVDPLPVLS